MRQLALTLLLVAGTARGERLDWTRLPRLIRHLDQRAAARDCARIVHRLGADPIGAGGQEVDADVLGETAAACATAATGAGPAAARADALACAVDLGDRALASRLAGDADAEVRAAAISLLAAGASDDDLTLLRNAAGDPDAGVAATASAILCRLTASAARPTSARSCAAAPRGASGSRGSGRRP